MFWCFIGIKLPITELQNLYWLHKLNDEDECSAVINVCLNSELCFSPQDCSSGLGRASGWFVLHVNHYHHSHWTWYSSGHHYRGWSVCLDPQEDVALVCLRANQLRAYGTSPAPMHTPANQWSRGYWLQSGPIETHYWRVEFNWPLHRKTLSGWVLINILNFYIFILKSCWPVDQN